MEQDRRDLKGYWDGAPPSPWPNAARVAVSFVVNIEEGAELSIGDGDPVNEGVHEAAQLVEGVPDPCMESHFGYGPRAGYRRIADALGKAGAIATFSTCGRAAQRTPWLIRDIIARGHEIGCHGWVWQPHCHLDEATERTHIARTYDILGELSGTPPVGWHTKSASSVNTRRLLLEHGGFLYDSDAYDDDIPRIERHQGQDHVVLPYAFDTNDMRFRPGGAFTHADDFARYCIAAFDRLWEEGHSEARMMSIGLHVRTIGRPARIGGLEAILAHMNAKGGAWMVSRRQIAECWRAACGLPAWASARV
ncbi:MAG: polysaccharide deacetylase family protein [Paracoccaceae bacterium]